MRFFVNRLLSCLCRRFVSTDWQAWVVLAAVKQTAGHTKKSTDRLVADPGGICRGGWILARKLLRLCFSALTFISRTHRPATEVTSPGWPRNGHLTTDGWLPTEPDIDSPRDTSFRLSRPFRVHVPDSCALSVAQAKWLYPPDQGSSPSPAPQANKKLQSRKAVRR